MTKTIWAMFVMCVCGLGCSSGAKEKPMPKTPRRVLFVGSELTSANGGVANALNRLSHGSLICVQSATEGRSLAWQWNQGGALQTLRSDRWDDVVLQENPRDLLIKRDMFQLFVGRFDAEIQRVGARTVVLVPIPRADQLQTGAVMFNACEETAATHHAMMAPVGIAFEAAARKRADLELYGGNKITPSPAGTYLAACVLYMTLLDRSPVGLENFVVDERGKALITLPPEDAKFLQQVAKETVIAERGEYDPEMEKMLKK
ncbi:MAG TPA: hypothetical protein VF669_13305 [Tepidisphaeraceae bacterium]